MKLAPHILLRWTIGGVVVFLAACAFLYLKLGITALFLFEAALVGVGLVALIGKRSELGLLLIFFFLPFERVPSIDLAGISLKANIVLGGLTIASTLLAMATRQRKLYLTAAHFLVLLYLAVQVVSMTQAVEIGRALKVIGFTAFVALGFSWLVPQLLTNRPLLVRVVRVLIASAAVVGLFGMFQFVGDLIGLPRGLTLIDIGFSKVVFGFPRIHAFSLEPLYLGNYLLLPLSLLAALLLMDVRTRLPKLLLLGLFLLLGIVLVLTVSRGAYAAAGVSVLLLAMSLPREVLQPRHLLAVGGLLVIVAGASYGFLASSESTEGTTALENFQRHVLLEDFQGSASGEGRLYSFTQAYELWNTHRWLGVGPGNFGPATRNYPDPKVDSAPGITNNQYLEVLAETGLVGFGVLFVLVLSLILRSMVALRQTVDPLVRAVLIGGTAAFVGMLVQYNFFSTLYIIHIWVTVGFLLAVQTIALQSHGKRYEELL